MVSPQPDVLLARQRALRKELRNKRLHCLLISNLTNVRYLSGFTGSYAWLLVFPRSAILITDSRYRLQAERQAVGATIALIGTSTLSKVAAQLLGQRGSQLRVGFEGDHLTYNDVRRLRRACRGQRLVPQSDFVKPLRMIKNESEIRLISRAVRITDLVYQEVVPKVRPGMTERDIASRLETAIRDQGAEVGFPTIVASGPNSALPHAQPSDRKLRDGDLLKVDIGARVAGYHADMTRTCIVGRASQRQQQIYEAVLAAQLAVIEKIRPGARAADLHNLAREVLSSRGLQDIMFQHGLGHGVGLAIHEWPTLRHDSKDVLAPGMVLTVEPGCYQEGFGGVRTEDIVLVTETGCKVLTGTPKPRALPRPEHMNLG